MSCWKSLQTHLSFTTQINWYLCSILVHQLHEPLHVTLEVVWIKLCIEPYSSMCGSNWVSLVLHGLLLRVRNKFGSPISQEMAWILSLSKNHLSREFGNWTVRLDAAGSFESVSDSSSIAKPVLYATRTWWIGRWVASSDCCVHAHHMLNHSDILVHCVNFIFSILPLLPAVFQPIGKQSLLLQKIVQKFCNHRNPVGSSHRVDTSTEKRELQRHCSSPRRVCDVSMTWIFPSAWSSESSWSSGTAEIICQRRGRQNWKIHIPVSAEQWHSHDVRRSRLLIRTLLFVLYIANDLSEFWLFQEPEYIVTQVQLSAVLR